MKKYVNQFISLEKKNKSNLIEIHNRPNYLKSLISELNNTENNENCKTMDVNNTNVNRESLEPKDSE